MDSQPPDVYADQFLVSANTYGVALSFSKTPPYPVPGQAPQLETQVIVRMSLQHAKVMALLLRKHLKTWERETGVEIAIPHEVLNQLGLSAEDW